MDDLELQSKRPKTECRQVREVRRVHTLAGSPDTGTVMYRSGEVTALDDDQTQFVWAIPPSDGFIPGLPKD